MAASAETPPGATDQPPDQRIQELVEDAWLYATYGRYSGSFRDARLFEAVAQALRERAPSDGLVVELQNALNQTARDIPYETVAALKRGWSPGRTDWVTKAVTVMLVIFSIVLMLSVARLTLIHNRGADLVEELSDIVADAPGTQLQKMIEDHARDRLELEREPPSNAQDFLSDYVPASLLVRQRDEIKALSRSVTDAFAEVRRYMDVDSRFPLIGTREAFCAMGKFVQFDVGAYSAYCEASRPDLANLPALGGSPPEATPANENQSANETAAKLNPAALGRDATVQPAAVIASAGVGGPIDCASRFLTFAELNGASGSALAKWNQLFRGEIEAMMCSRTLTYDPSVERLGLQSLLDELKRRVGYYALWILPALYGAMGAVMYHMRWVLDPLLPHPSLLRLAHRIVLGALAGIVLGWFYGPGTAISDAADSVGFSLFVVAFFFGFSLDIFFAMLDRLVARSERSIRGNMPTDREAVLSALRARREAEGARPEGRPREPAPTAIFSRSAPTPG